METLLRVKYDWTILNIDMEFTKVLIQVEKLSAGHAAVRRYKEISLYQLSKTLLTELKKKTSVY